MALRTYYDFAYDDYRYFNSSYERGEVWNSMAALAQNSCEKFLKHMIDVYKKPVNTMDSLTKQAILKSHNLAKLIRYIQEDMHFPIPKGLEDSLKQINGFYFSTRYPGEDSITVNKSDIDSCKKTMDLCVKFVKESIIEKETLHTDQNIAAMIISTAVPETLKEQILRESYNNISWNKVPLETMELIREQYPRFYQDYGFEQLNRNE
ncbi:MAG: HEPN domain-containing protein [Lachnospiraceae bacterium]